MTFSNGVTACVNITKAGTNQRQMTTTTNGGASSNLRCDLMTPDSNLRSISSCNGQFSYNQTIMGKIKLWIRYSEAAPINRNNKPNNDSQRTYPQWTYDFNNGGRIDDNASNTVTNTTNTTLNNFSLSTNNSSPTTYQYVNLNIQARDYNNYIITNFTDTVNFRVYYGNANTNSWTQTSSSNYYAINSSYNNYGYAFNTSNNGYAYLSNFIQFKNSSYDYKVRVYDANNSSIYKEIIFYVNNANNNNNNNNNTSNGNLNNFSLTTDDSTPATYQYVNLNIQARDYNNSIINNFSDTVKFQVYYGNANNNSWYQTSSSSYYTMNSNYNYYGYTFNTSNNGYAYLSNFIQFTNSSYDYKVRVYDSNNSSIYKEIIFYVNNTNNNNNNYNNTNIDNFAVTTDNSSPSTFNRVDLSVVARDTNNNTVTNFTDNLIFRIYYRTSPNNAWIETTSSSYFAINSPWSSNYQYGIPFSSSRNGSYTFSNIIEFKQNYDYKVVVQDANNSNILGYNIFSVGNSSSASNVAGFSTSQLQTVQNIYNARNNMINNLQNNYPRLSSNNIRQNMSSNLYSAMQQIINNNSIKTYYNFNDFYNAFLDWYKYTVSTR